MSAAMTEKIKSDLTADFHCHVLPGMDDGAADTEQSASMLHSLHSQGVRHCVITPHFYPSRESVNSFLERRQYCYGKLMSIYDEDSMPRIALGAEVRISPNMSHMDLEKLCINGTDVILLEFPYTDFEQWMVTELEQIIYSYGLHPIIAHTDRVIASFSGTHFKDLLSFDEFIFQINNEALANFFSRRRILSLFDDTQLCVLGSDCHDTKRRKPNFDVACKYLTDKKKASVLYESVIQTSQTLVEKLFS